MSFSPDNRDLRTAVSPSIFSIKRAVRPPIFKDKNPETKLLNLIVPSYDSVEKANSPVSDELPPDARTPPSLYFAPFFNTRNSIHSPRFTARDHPTPRGSPIFQPVSQPPPHQLVFPPGHVPVDGATPFSRVPNLPFREPSNAGTNGVCKPPLKNS